MNIFILKNVKFGVVIAILILVFGISLSNAQPKILINKGVDTYKWGKVKSKPGQIQANIEIKNVGNETLNISNVKPSCSCTNAPLEKNTLAPNEFINLKVTVNLPSNAGTFNKSITISSNDPTSAAKVLMLEGEVVKPILSEPNTSFMFNDLKVGNESLSKLTLKNVTDQDITINEITVYPSEFKINLPVKTIIKAHQSRDIICSYSPLKAGFINMSVLMKTDYDEDPDMTITGYGEVKESISLFGK